MTEPTKTELMYGSQLTGRGDFVTYEIKLTLERPLDICSTCFKTKLIAELKRDYVP